ncbi:MAG: tRNA preQ1(34) S-adenosylmethionine ribosyltransferase-isomerase QueA [Acidobacteria bacterium]|nr:tRNA preQ1(34) S-adenosylmethionine ribosyltransferase-isomerase QueA [Acidobacteriota bacterium]
MQRADFDYELPAELIAQEPAPERDRSRMLVVDRARGVWRDESFAELPSMLGPDDLVVLNNTRVFPARLVGRRMISGASGAQVEALLIARAEDGENEWEVLAKPGRALRIGAEIDFGCGRLRGVVVSAGEEGRRRIRFDCPSDQFERIVDEIGNTPLPPYIRRERTARIDEPRYQTVYARRRGAIAAPTAGLHFTPRVLEELRARGVDTIEITHHVGYATFQPVRVERIEEHRIAAERYEITPEAAETINRRRASGGRLLAVGTTSVRALESAAEDGGTVRPGSGVTGLFIYPGYRFRVVDALLTNFHLPESSLLMLVAAFGGREPILEAYRHAVAARYRFYSYGDCMLIV